ncbi:flagellar biosynthesis anti-sigma factor FlgM [Yersinia bercovieri]|uniref:flagellar biosynthesis anti-sigma factor FlgM n=1 Tax=Yersinia bercovieri TaxID=634 RepID=UPI0005E1DD45|nr:flagellar biosynthesis anti-sigma factor FlgM [Yersinia bercovieri]CFQ44315.1 flagellar regulatory protein [Yersinia bercovieri]CNF67824.1 flagellar regulatory protein [Yersinia bercovieri]
MEINAHLRQAVVTTPTATTENPQAIQPIAPVKAMENTPQHGGAVAGELHAKLQAMPDIDSERVTAIKADIQAGKITLNTAEIAKAMLNFHRS